MLHRVLVIQLAIYINVYITIVTRYLVLSFVLSVFNSGCTVIPPVKQPPVDSTKTDIQKLLFFADTAMEQNRLTTPTDDNAFDHYKQVLRLDPSNELAIDDPRPCEEVERLIAQKILCLGERTGEVE